jgi:epoxyqueuosine reductase
MLTTLALTRAVKSRALELGFDAVATGRARPPAHGEAFVRWLEAGHAGTMGYLARSRDDRLDPARLLPGVRSVVAVALAYAREDDGEDWRSVARYARGRDYHAVMRPRLHALRDFLREAGPPGTESRAAVDTSAVLERDAAAAAGLGWIGKNTNLITPALGSYFFIGCVLTTAELAADEAVPDRCGTCTACLEACPTGAFTGPWSLDARRCLAYLTIEHRGDIDETLRPAVRDWVFGCDVCQEVCPWNRKAPPARDPALAPAAPLGPLADLLELDPAAFRDRFRSTAVSRATRGGLLRNAALVLGNRGDGAAVPALRRALEDADDTVRQAAAWALGRLEPPASAPSSGARPRATMGAMQVRRLDHFGVDVVDLDRAERFYTEVLGMTVRMRLPDQVLLAYGDGSCALFLRPDRPPGSLEQIANPLGKSHHAFEVSYEDLLGARALFAERNVPHHAPIDWGDHDCLYFLDPDGNLLELVGYR